MLTFSLQLRRGRSSMRLRLPCAAAPRHSLSLRSLRGSATIWRGALHKNGGAESGRRGARSRAAHTPHTHTDTSHTPRLLPHPQHRYPQVPRWPLPRRHHARVVRLLERVAQAASSRSRRVARPASPDGGGGKGGVLASRAERRALQLPRPVAMRRHRVREHDRQPLHTDRPAARETKIEHVRRWHERASAFLI